MARNDSSGSVRSRRRRNRALVSAHRSRGFGGPGKCGSRYFLVNCSVISGMGSECVSPAITGVSAIRTRGEIGWAAADVDPLSCPVLRAAADLLGPPAEPSPRPAGRQPVTPAGSAVDGSGVRCIASAPNGPCHARIRAAYGPRRRSYSSVARSPLVARCAKPHALSRRRRRRSSARESRHAKFRRGPHNCTPCRTSAWPGNGGSSSRRPSQGDKVVHSAASADGLPDRIEWRFSGLAVVSPGPDRPPRNLGLARHVSCPGWLQVIPPAGRATAGKAAMTKR